MNVDVQQQRVTNRDANDRDGVGDPQHRAPMRGVQSKQAAKCDDQITSVPTNHADAEPQQQTLNRNDAESLLEQEISHPQRQHCAQAVTD